MPTYEYVCRGCGLAFERFQSITAPAVRTCPRCGARKVERQIGIGGAVIFKGGGFYETDYRSDSYRKGEESERSAQSAGGKDASSNADTAKAAASKSDAAKPSPSASTGDAGAGSTGSSKSEAADADSTKATPEARPAKSKASAPRETRGKNHAREGRGIGNVLQLGRKGQGRDTRSKKMRAGRNKK
ncbi:MAG: zinc ribbon domain-containing protein [Planctomycetes bacterium]|nr:zinc ribbon domain-containing protein [Planctomycetota bacterium]